jgi:V/A-type H+-transporting ATPase subunit I
MRSMPADGTCWLVVHRDSRLSYVVVVADEEPVGIPAERTHAGARALSRLRERQEAVQIEIDEFEAQRARESRWCDLFGASLDRLEDAAARRAACGATHDDAPFFCITAWIAESSAQSVRQFAASRSLACLLRPPVAGEDPPTLLQNRGIAAFGEDLLRFYLVPGYGGWDPSRSIFWFFAAFVAVILADAGYAAVLAVGLAFLWRRLGRSAAGARGRSLAAAAVLASLAWGVLVGSYFGVAAEPGSLAARAALVPMGDPSAYVTLALSLGAAQIAFANLASAWHFGGRDAIARLGWVALIGGGLSLWFSRPPATDLLSAPGAWACLAGWAAIAVFSGGRRGVARRVADGALGIARTVGLFGDVLSYLRLFALAFAGASLASAFNELASRAASGAPGVGLLAGLAILVVGHAANLGLGVASALVHGLRLNLIEYLNWSIVGEGRPFQQFSCKEKQPWSSH